MFCPGKARTIANTRSEIKCKPKVKFSKENPKQKKKKEYIEINTKAKMEHKLLIASSLQCKVLYMCQMEWLKFHLLLDFIDWLFINWLKVNVESFCYAKDRKLSVHSAIKFAHRKWSIVSIIPHRVTWANEHSEQIGANVWYKWNVQKKVAFLYNCIWSSAYIYV